MKSQRALLVSATAGVSPLAHVIMSAQRKDGRGPVNTAGIQSSSHREDIQLTGVMNEAWL